MNLHNLSFNPNAMSVMPLHNKKTSEKKTSFRVSLKVTTSMGTPSVKQLHTVLISSELGVSDYIMTNWEQEAIMEGGLQRALKSF